MTSVVVISPGLHTTVQDLGRWGHQAEGVPVAGAMDPFHHRLANALVGNDRNAATLEITLTGPEVLFETSLLTAVTGAAFDLFVDDVATAEGTAVPIPAGSTLRFGARRAGARAYLAVTGGFDVPPVLGSRSTHVLTGMGGWFGRPLKRADRLPVRILSDEARLNPRTMTPPLVVNQVRPQPHSALEIDAAERARHAAVVRVLRGPQHDRFADDALDALTAEPYIVGTDSNRMGYRLEGRRVRHRGAADIISDAAPLGALQVPASGQPVLLMADRQTVGGYAKLATVISADIGIAAQAAPGDRLQFRICEPADAIAALVEREQRLLAVEHDVT
jgi:antagonist of KipI